MIQHKSNGSNNLRGGGQSGRGNSSRRSAGAGVPSAGNSKDIVQRMPSRNQQSSRNGNATQNSGQNQGAGTRRGTQNTGQSQGAGTRRSTQNSGQNQGAGTRRSTQNTGQNQGAGRTAPNNGTGPERSRSAGGADEEMVTYSRVQGGNSKEMLSVNDDGTVSMNPDFADQRMYVSTGEDHANYFKNKRGDDAYIVKADIPKYLHDLITETAIPQEHLRNPEKNQGGMAPDISDPGVFKRNNFEGSAYGLPAPLSEWFVEYAQNARIVKNEEDKQNSDRQAAQQAAQQDQKRQEEQGKQQEQARQDEQRKREEQQKQEQARQEQVRKAEQTKQEEQRKQEEQKRQQQQARQQEQAKQEAQRQESQPAENRPNVQQNQAAEQSRQQANDQKTQQDNARIAQDSRNQEQLRQQIKESKTQTDNARQAQQSEKQEQQRKQTNDDKAAQENKPGKPDVDVSYTLYQQNLYSHHAESAGYETSTRKESENGFSETKLSAMGTETNANVDLSIGSDGLSLEAGASAEAHALRVGAAGETTVGDAKLSGEANLTLMQAEAKAEGNVNIGPTGASVSADLRAGVNLARVQAEGAIETEYGSLSGEVDAKVGVEAYANGEAAIGFEDGKLNAHAGGEAGVKLASVEASGEVDVGGLFSVRGTAEASAGLGVEGGIGIKDNVFYLKFGANVGVGGSLGVEVDFSGLVDKADEIVEGVKDFAGDAWEGVTNFAEDAWEGAKDFAEDAWDFISFWD